MKIKIVGKDLDNIKNLLKKDFEISDENYDLMVVHGGDGSFLEAERKYPGVAKFAIRDNSTAPHCEKHHIDYQIDLLKTKKLKKQSLIKLEATIKNQKVYGINDIFIHNALRVNAVRYKVWINDELYAEEIMGDGVGLSTILGSTAYYRSITHSIFRVGLGLAFSNSTEAVDHLVIPENSVVSVEIIRGPALISADNNQSYISINSGDKITIKKSSKFATVYGLDLFMCKDCRLLRHSRNFKHLRK